MVLAGFASAGSPGAQDSQKSLWDTIMGRPATGANGYEEYIRAADLLRTAPLRDLLDKARQGTDGKSFLASRREVVTRAKAVLDLVRRGSQKAVTEPRADLDYMTLFPELSLFRRISYLFQMESYVRFASGDSTGGVTSILDGITFSRKASQGTLISYLVHLAGTAILLGEVEERLPHLSQADASRLLAAAKAWLSETDPLIRAIQGEQQFMLRSLDRAIKESVDDTLFSRDDDDFKVLEAIRSMSPRERERILREVQARLSRDLAQVMALLQKEERYWTDPTEEVEAGDSPTDILYSLFSPFHGATLSAAARSRTQIRLLALHSSVAIFKWEHNRLPGRLEDFAEPGLRLDPLTGKPFVYRFLGEGRYELYSEGSEETGRIDLRYRRPERGSGADPNEPPEP